MKFSAILVKPLTLISLICGAITYTGSFIASASNADYSYLPASEVKQLQVENQSVPALLRPWLGHKQLGLAIIVPALGERADAPGLASYLRRELNDAGWATLALTPPEPADTSTEINTAIETGNQLTKQPEQASDSQLTAEQVAKTKLQQDFMLASMAQLDALGKHFSGKRMLVTMGDSANLIIELLASKRLPMPDLLVIVNPYSELESVNNALPEKLASLAIPVLDIQSKDGTAASISTQLKRRSLAPANAPTRYSQQVLALDLTLEMAWDNSLELIEGFASRINKAYPNG
ncbi:MULTISPECIES: alpha/beta hydrolase family protein [unclassified Shewanella]|uniref:alpha/beta hydrolase family protein n=1 Tax=unclassified Shewanella TaxID=196818 RepID=UPI002180164D|nr:MULTISPECIES: alpha/beta hydrolase family protein [unclassified Shewanella]